MTLSTLLRVAKKIIHNGPAWTIARVNQEFKNPSFRITRRVMDSFNAAKKRLRIGHGDVKQESGEQVIAVYDLNSNPLTFDFAFFLLGAELFARRHGKDTFVVYFVQMKNTEARGDAQYVEIINEDSQKWRFDNLVLPLISLCPACAGYTVLPKGVAVRQFSATDLVYPEYYDGRYTPAMDYREIYRSAANEVFVGLRALPQGLKYLQSWKKANGLVGNIVTITLRQYAYDAGRNSNIDEWVKFAAYIKEDGFTPVFIPDTDACYEYDHRLEAFLIFREPCWNMGLRMAIYEDALLNFFSPNGPAALCQLNKKAKYIHMKTLVPGSLQCTKEILEDKGIKVGQRRFDFAESYQILSWDEDRFEFIRAEFLNFLAAYKKEESITNSLE